MHELEVTAVDGRVEHARAASAHRNHLDGADGDGVGELDGPDRAIELARDLRPQLEGPAEVDRSPREDDGLLVDEPSPIDATASNRERGHDAHDEEPPHGARVSTQVARRK